MKREEIIAALIYDFERNGPLKKIVIDMIFDEMRRNKALGIVVKRLIDRRHPKET